MTAIPRTLQPQLARIALVVLLLIALVSSVAVAPRVAAAVPTLHGLHVSANQLKNGSGQVVRLRGVNRSGFEYACVQGWGFTDGAVDAASVEAMLDWGINSVRNPLNEGCWLDINTPNPAYSGANYRAAVTNYVNLLTDAGIAVTLDLHWAAPGNLTPNEQRPMANRDHSPAFWTSVATALRANDLVLFDLYNEPYPNDNQDTDEAWRCWRDGGTCTDVAYQAAGMQELVEAVRAADAPNVILLSGVQYSGGLDHWLEYRPTDPLDNLAASWHTYEFSWHHDDPAYWEATIGELMDEVPVILGEVG